MEVARMPYWALLIVIVVLVVGYYLLTQSARQRRRDRVGVDFARMPDFYANQTYTDVGGETAIGIDDRGRRLALARKRAQPRTRVYSFAHILSVEVLQDAKVLARIPAERAAAGEDPPPEEAADSLFGSTRPESRIGIIGPPVIRPDMGQVGVVGVRVRLRNGDAVDEALVRFYDGKPVNVDGVVGERAFSEAQVLMGSLDIAMKRAGSPPRGATFTSVPGR
jgi:hypothetical protein